MQEAVHMVDKQELAICSESVTYISITQGQVLQDELEMVKNKILSLCIKTVKKKDLSLEQFFYRGFVHTTFKKSKNGVSDDNDERDAIASNEHRILVPKGMNCIPRYPVDYDYA
jgi:hypothetical protein